MNNPDMTRKQKFANQTVQQGCFAVTYNELGYAVKAVLTSNSPGYVADDGTVVPGEPIKRK
ncbi:MAG: hypothetical protein VB053_09035 [Oscillibacter ruminantium]|uniref:hypothetical protein n=1 Tax=Oscillibacter ruminantium TaxID=1263547 RepID=UPI002B1F850A|nr:hypothetical protein [Oscillibacter ruminantium]MEA5042665.1 hypothetical protein [Oscillibacter ruminantium]